MRTAAHWDDLYLRGQTPWRTKPVDLAAWLELANISGGTALELGCGTGERLAELGLRGFECEGIDWSEAALAAAAIAAPHARLAKWDLDRLAEYPFRHRRYDLVVDIKTIAFIRDKARYLNALAPRVGGACIIETYLRHDEDPTVAVVESELMPLLLARFRLIRRRDTAFPHKDMAEFFLAPR